MKSEDINPYTSLDEYRAALEERERGEVRAEKLRADFRSVTATEWGRRVLDYICKDLCGEGKGCFSDNALIMARLAGRQEVALLIRGMQSDEQAMQDYANASQGMQTHAN